MSTINLNSASLPSGPLRFAPSNSGPSKPHTFSLRYPASHPSDLSTAGASLSSAASGDVSLRMAPSPSLGEPRGRRWAGRQVRPTAEVECAIVWDENQHCWVLHRLDNVVQLAPDDPEPLPKKAAIGNTISQRQVPLALPKPALAVPPPPPVVSLQSGRLDPSRRVHQNSPSNNSLHQTSSPVTQPQPNAASNGTQNQKLSSQQQIRMDRKISGLPSPPSSSSNQPQPQNARPKKSSLGASSSEPQPTNKSSGTPSNNNLVLPQKRSIIGNINSQKTTKNPSASPPGEQGPISVVQADEVEEFDFVDSPPDPDPVVVPPQPAVGPSPVTVPSPAPPNTSHSAPNWQQNPQRGTISEMATSPAGRPTLSRSSSVADQNGMSNGSPLARPNGSHALALPAKSSINRTSAPSPAYPYSALSRTGNISTQPTAPSPLQSVAYSSDSSPNATQTAATPLLVSLSPPSVTATTVDSNSGGQAGSCRSSVLPSSVTQSGRTDNGSPAPAWQYTQHLQQQPRIGSPHGINGTRSPASNATSSHLGLVKTHSTSSVPQRAYQRSDSGSSVRESDTDSEDDDDEEDSSEDEAQFEPVPPPPQPAPVPTEPPRGSEDDAEAEDDDDEDDEFELQNFATELEASMMIGDFCGSEAGAALNSYNSNNQASQMEVQEPVTNTNTKSKGSKKASSNSKTTGNGKSTGGSKPRARGKGSKAQS